MKTVYGIAGKCNQELIVRLTRKQINDLKNVLSVLEADCFLDEKTFHNLNRVEEQIHWLRTAVFSIAN